MDFLCRGHLLADVSAILGSLDIVFGEWIDEHDHCAQDTDEGARVFLRGSKRSRRALRLVDGEIVCHGA